MGPPSFRHLKIELFLMILTKPAPENSGHFKYESHKTSHYITPDPANT